MKKNIDVKELENFFLNPPSEYGSITNYWWEFGKIEKDKCLFQIKDLKEKGLSGVLLYDRYTPTEKGGADPSAFTEKWWEMVKFFVEESKKLGMEYWFSNWEGQRYWQDFMLKEVKDNTKLGGHRLSIYDVISSNQKKQLEIIIPPDEEILDVAAFKKKNNGLDFSTRISLKNKLKNNKITWSAPESDWLLIVIVSSPYELDYIDGEAAKRWIELYWNEFKKRMPEHLGKTIKGYIQDEFRVLDGNILYSKTIIEKIKKDKNFDISNYLVGLFYDIGKITDKIRCNYYDVMVSLLEKNLYGEISNWLEKNNLIFGTSATWGRLDILAQTYHYGDFFRFMRHFNIPGNEDPGCSKIGERRLIDDKLSSSIAHIYNKDSALMIGPWQSGWGLTQETNIAWTNELYAYGINKYVWPAGRYTLHGGWFEAVPPLNCFYPPHWSHWMKFAEYIKRLSYILRQGTHIADVAILYPITTIHAHWSKGKYFSNWADYCANQTFNIAQVIYKNDIDFDFIDNDSLEKAIIENGRMSVNNIKFRVLVLPPMTTINIKILEKIKEFYESGGIVIGYNVLPSASAENGREDRQVSTLIGSIFGIESSETYEMECKFHHDRGGYSIHKNKNKNGGEAFFVPSNELLIIDLINSIIVPDFKVLGGTDIYHAEQFENQELENKILGKIKSGIFHIHKKINDLDIYFLFNSNNSKKDLEIIFRVKGKPEIWDQYTGKVKIFNSFEILKAGTRVKLIMNKYEGLVIAFRPYDDSPQVVQDNIELIESVNEKKGKIKIRGFSSIGGRKKLLIKYKDREYVAEKRFNNPPEPLSINSKWSFSLKPTMHNKWGDYRFPASNEFIGPEARKFKYIQESGKDGLTLGWHNPEFDESSWKSYIYTFGPYFWSIGPFTEEPEGLLFDIENNNLDSKKIYQNRNGAYRWSHYDFSQVFGSEDKAVHYGSGQIGIQGVSENFITFPGINNGKDVTRYLYTYVVSNEEKDVMLDFGSETKIMDKWTQDVESFLNFPKTAWLNGKKVINIIGQERADSKTKIHLNKGINRLVLKAIQLNGSRLWTYINICEINENIEDNFLVPKLKWFIKKSDFIYDIKPEEKNIIGWYRFDGPPGLKELEFNIEALKFSCWIDGDEINIEGNRIILKYPKENVSKIALKVLHKHGIYGGSAFKEPVKFKCQKTRITLDNWENYALESYSGGGIYENKFNLNKEHLKGKVIVDLGIVQITSELIINGKPLGIKMADPYKYDITNLVKEGENKIEVKVFNTLANHYNIGYPTRFVFKNQTISGLIGPVTINFLSVIEMDALPSSGNELEKIRNSNSQNMDQMGI